MSLTEPSEDRYARHRLMDWWDQEKLADARVLVAGAGAIGNEVVKLLALLGVGHVLIVDFDMVELSNLTRSVLFRESDIGRPKADVAAERARELNPDIEVRSAQGDLEFGIGLGVYRAMDVVLGCLDSIQARLALNRACARVGVPWINGGIEDTVAEVALYGGVEAACYECALSPAMWERRNQRFSCSGLQTDVPEIKMPTTATVASLAAAYMVNEALFLLHRAPDGAKDGLRFGQKLYLTLKPYGFYTQDLPRDPHCLAHERWEPVEALERSPGELTTRELLKEVGMPSGILELGYDLLAAMQCVQCGARELVLRPAETCRLSLTTCPECRTESRQPEILSWLDADSEFADRTLHTLGIPDYPMVVVKDGEAHRIIQLTGIYDFR